MNERMINEYLDACGAVPLCLIPDQDGCFALKQGRAASRTCSAEHVFWVTKEKAVAIGRAYRIEAEGTSGLKAAQAALHRAASRYGVTPTPNATAVSRAELMAVKLDAEINRLRNVGALKAFNVAYQARRVAHGGGFMTYSVAMSRLRKLLIARITNVGVQYPVTKLFEEVFGNAHGSGTQSCTGQT